MAMHDHTRNSWMLLKRGFTIMPGSPISSYHLIVIKIIKFIILLYSNFFNYKMLFTAGVLVHTLETSCYQDDDDDDV